ncbi:histidine phosphatase family protein [Luteimonas soli]|uniref:Histidine phosphatase family protein n=1 Tax=Luteimonas soli TaxID=1648966 RepID=A0ABV7XL14_9GAMM
MHAPLRFLILACALALSACAVIPAFSPSVTYVVVRHAEKVGDGSRDPSLTDAGRARAHALAARLRSRDVVAVYATDFRRTRNTAEPTAATHDLSIISYDADAPPKAVAERLRRAHATGTVLVVGHSNTVPGIVSALCGCEVAPIDESDYGNLFEVRIRAGAAPVLSQQRY